MSQAAHKFLDAAKGENSPDTGARQSAAAQKLAQYEKSSRELIQQLTSGSPLAELGPGDLGSEIKLPVLKMEGSFEKGEYSLAVQNPETKSMLKSQPFFSPDSPALPERVEIVGLPFLGEIRRWPGLALDPMDVDNTKTNELQVLFYLRGHHARLRLPLQ